MNNKTRWTDGNGVTWITARDYAADHGYDEKRFVRHARKTGDAKQPFGERSVWVVRADADIPMPTGGTRGLTNGYRMIIRVPVVNGEPDPTIIQWCVDNGCSFRDPGAERRAGKLAMANGLAAMTNE